MTALDWAERGTGWVGGLAVALTLALILMGIYRGTQRAAGRSTGRSPRWLQSLTFYVVASLVYFGLCWLLWRPLPLVLTPVARLVCLVGGSVIFFSGLGLVVWGRLTLGGQYFVSTTIGAQLFDQHRLVINGPYGLMRHPMYVGILLTGLGGILLYRTWTMVFVAFHFVGLTVRARREEQALATEFGEDWQAYCCRTPRWLPRPTREAFQRGWSRLPASVKALLEVVILFIPAIPAYIWIWPVVSGTGAWIVQSLVYVYVILGSLFIGLRRWSLAELGFNKNGWGVSLAAGMVVVIGRSLVILSIDWGASSPGFSPARLLVEGLYYFGLVGLGEELLFRGLLYRAFQEWRGVRWAVWFTSLGFVLWHIFGQGPLVGAAMLFYGLIFALMRWRAGSISGLIFIHGLIDFSAFLLMPDIHVTALGRPDIPHPAWLVVGLALIAFTPLYLWMVHPLLTQREAIRSA